MSKLLHANTLDEAIKQILCVGPLCEVIKNAPLDMRNFLAQKFAVAYINADSDEEIERLKKLWHAILNGDQQ